MPNDPVVRLGDHCLKIGSGATPRGGNESYKSSGIALIRSQNVYNDGFTHSGLAFIDEQQASLLDGASVQHGDVLLNITGDSVARCCLPPDDLGAARVNQHVAIIRVDRYSFDHRYLRYWFVSPSVQQELLGLASAGATRNALTKSMISDLRVPMPSLREQHAIAAVLGSLDDKIELNRHMNATLEATARAIFKAWFVDFEALPVEAGRREPVAMVAEAGGQYGARRCSLSAGRFTSIRVEELADINALVLRASDEMATIDYVEISEVNRGDVGVVQRYRRGQEPSRARRILRNGDTVISTVRPDRGAHFLCLAPPHGLIASTGFAVLSPRSVPWSFLYAALTMPEVGEYLGRVADGGAYPAIRPEKIGEMTLSVPQDSSVLNAFHDIASPLYQLAESNRRESRTLAALRDTLLPKLLSGEVRVKDIA